tara:strand:+ start:730 stop:855 length:126 start_codon:yes stop_codon:yes gene_type:complete
MLAKVGSSAEVYTDEGKVLVITNTKISIDKICTLVLATVDG